MTREHDTTVIARTVARVVFPIIVVTAIALLLQGHNLPGGGFIAGTLTAAAVGLVYVIYGLDYLERELLDRTPSAPFTDDAGVEREYGTLVTTGLAIAAGSGIVALLFGEAFLTQAVWFFEHVPLYGHFEVASALAFDLGVYAVVVGGLLTILAVVGGE